MTKGDDCLVEVLKDLRPRGMAIPLWDADRRANWFAELAQWIVQLKNEEQRRAWVILIGNDEAGRHGIPLCIAIQPLLAQLQELERIRG